LDSKDARFWVIGGEDFFGVSAAGSERMLAKDIGSAFRTGFSSAGAWCSATGGGLIDQGLLVESPFSREGDCAIMS
jgi:hypothetical protein